MVSKLAQLTPNGTPNPLSVLEERLRCVHEMLKLKQHCPEAEIARRLGTSRSVVAVTLWRARARLRTLLTSTADEPRTAV